MDPRDKDAKKLRRTLTLFLIISLLIHITAQGTLNNIDYAIQHVASIRANFGALQSRLQSTINNLDIYHENMSEANSRIRDADLAHETAELARNNILMNAGMSVLLQANNTTAMALKLLNG